MSARPELSIIVATRERPDRLPRAVASAHRATSRTHEVIVVDDGSTDDTARTASALPGVRYVRVDTNQGVAGARNIGLLASEGRCLAFLDDDDERVDGSYDWQLDVLTADATAAVVYGQAIVSDDRLQPRGPVYPDPCPEGDLFWTLQVQNVIPCGAAVFRRTALECVGLLDDSLAGIDDWDLWIRLSALFPIRAVHAPVLRWRQSTPASGQGSSRAGALAAMTRRASQERWLRHPRALAATHAQRGAVARQLAARVAAHLLYESWRAVAHHQLGAAASTLSWTIAHQPGATLRTLARPSTLRRIVAAG